MGRPHKYRKLSQFRPRFNYFRPKGMNQGDFKSFEKIYLTAEEFEALRLKHYENLKQNNAAEKMCISQTTFSRILVKAHQKMTQALVEGLSITIQSHSTSKPCPVIDMHQEKFINSPTDPLKTAFYGYSCLNCGFEWAIPETEDSKSVKSEKPICPECSSNKTYKLIKKMYI